mgnify:CR=1 FL=1
MLPCCIHTCKLSIIKILEVEDVGVIDTLMLGLYSVPVVTLVNIVSVEFVP